MRKKVNVRKLLSPVLCLVLVMPMFSINAFAGQSTNQLPPIHTGTSANARPYRDFLQTFFNQHIHRWWFEGSNVNAFTNAFVVLDDGSLWAWGQNEGGILGNGTTQNIPVPVMILESVFNVLPQSGSWGSGSSGGYASGSLGVSESFFSGNFGNVFRSGHNFALGTCGTLFAWGTNTQGQLGNSNTVNQTSPVSIMDDVVSVSADRNRAFALRSDGSLWAWGNNSNGDLGDGTRTNRNNPVRILNNIVAFSATVRAGRMLALCANGDLWMWGPQMIPPRDEDLILAPIRITGSLIPRGERNRLDMFMADDGREFTWRPQAMLRSVDTQMIQTRPTPPSAPVPTPTPQVASPIGKWISEAGETIQLRGDGTGEYIIVFAHADGRERGRIESTFRWSMHYDGSMDVSQIRSTRMNSIPAGMMGFAGNLFFGDATNTLYIIPETGSFIPLFRYIEGNVVISAPGRVTR